MEKFKIGQVVYWHDPAKETSGIYRILNIPNSDDSLEPNDLLNINDNQTVVDYYDDLIILIGNDYSEAEVFACELEILDESEMSESIHSDPSLLGV